MVPLQTVQIQSFGESLVVIIAYILIGFIMQRAGYLTPILYNESDYKRMHDNDPKYIAWSRDQFKLFLIFTPIKYIGNFLYYVVLPLQYFQILSISLTAYSSIIHKNNQQTLFFYQNLIICIVVKAFLLIIAASLSICLYYSTNRKRKSHQSSGILTNEEDVTQYMLQYRQCLLHDHPLAKCCVFGLFLTSTYDISIGIPLVQSIYALDEDTDYIQYIYLYSLIQLLLIVPFCLLLLDIALLSVQKKYNDLKEQELIIKLSMASADSNKQSLNDIIQQQDDNISDNEIDTDFDTEYEESTESHHIFEQSTPKSAVLNVFLSSLNKVQVLNQELQKKEEIQRISRLKALANYPLPHKGSITSLSCSSDGDSPVTDYDAMISSTNKDAFSCKYNAPYEPKPTLSEQRPASPQRKNAVEDEKLCSNKTIDVDINENHDEQKEINVSSGFERHNSEITIICKRVMAKLILNPIIIASFCGMICNAFISQSVLITIEPYLNNISSIYEFLALYLVGSLLAIFFQQRENIFKFAAATHENTKSNILLHAKSNVNHNNHKAGVKLVDDVPHAMVATRSLTTHLPEFDVLNEEQTNIWTYTHLASGAINFKQKRVRMTQIHNNTQYAISSISLMNTDNVMMWWWSLSFVLMRYLLSSLSFKFVTFAVYEAYGSDMHNMELMNYLYGTLTPNLLSVLIAMKYNIYISFITISYMISIVLYPIIVFCGLFLLNGVKFDTMKHSVLIVIFAVQICSICCALFVLLFWCGFKHWRTYPITIFMAVLVLDVAYNASLFCCELYHDEYPFIICIVYWLREWLHLLLISAAFQCVFLISNHNVLKKDLKRYHAIIQPFIFIISLIVASCLWFIRNDAITNKFVFRFIWRYPESVFVKTYNVQCQYSSKLQLEIDLIIQCMNVALLMLMFCYILRKRYQYQQIVNISAAVVKNRSIFFRALFCCYFSFSCKCCIDKKSKNDKKKPLLVIEQERKEEEMDDDKDMDHDIELRNIQNTQLPQHLMVDGKSIQIHHDHKKRSYSSISIIPLTQSAVIACDPRSFQTYYAFDYYAYSLIIFCVTLIGFIANVIFIVFLLSCMDENKLNNSRVLELFMLFSLFQHSQTFVIAILFLSTKPIKRLTKNIAKRFVIQCRKIVINIKKKVEIDQHHDDENNNQSLKSQDTKQVRIPRQFYQKLPVLL